MRSGQLGSRITLVAAVVQRDFLVLRRYLFNLVSGLVSLYILFLIVFFGAQRLGGTDVAYGNTLDGIVVGFVVWSFAITAFSELAWGITDEAKNGTLEQLFLSPLGYSWIGVGSMIMSFLQFCVGHGLLLLLMMVTSGRWLSIDLVSVLPVLFLTVIGVYGIGFIMAGLALVFKRIESVFQLLQFVFIAFLTIPLDQFSWAGLLPLAYGNHLLFRIMVEEERIWQFAATDHLTLVVSGFGYLTLGILAFRCFEHLSRVRGTLGHY